MIEEIIKKSLEAKYTHKSYNLELILNERMLSDDIFRELVMDSEFWKALFSDDYKEVGVYFDGEFGEMAVQVEWLGHAMNFHKINLTESFESAVEYLYKVLFNEK